MVISEQLKELYPYTGEFISVNGGNLHYLDEGEAKKGRRRERK